MTLLCKYKNILGIPKQGMHKLRFGPFGFIDIIATLVLAGVISYFTDINSLYTFILLFIIGQILHWLFCVNTSFMNMLNW
jgi:hypothetical protein